jgi:hypothetical protein
MNERWTLYDVIDANEALDFKEEQEARDAERLRKGSKGR